METANVTPVDLAIATPAVLASEGKDATNHDATNNDARYEDKQGDRLLQLVTFTIASEEFGVEILKVQEIIRTLDITRVPRSPAFVEGVINLRGKVIPIIDLRRRFGIESKVKDKDTRIIVIEINTMIVGFVVDSVSEVLRIPASTVEPPPSIVAGVDSEYISGVGKLNDRLLIMIDLNKLLSPEEQHGLGNLSE
jgi:purine-binding chemotaxis protein CheW